MVKLKNLIVLFLIELTCMCMHAKSLPSCPTLCDPMDCTLPGSSDLGFSRQEYWSGLPCPPPGDLTSPGMKPTFLMSPALSGGFFTTSTTWEAPPTCMGLLKIVTATMYSLIIAYV